MATEADIICHKGAARRIRVEMRPAISIAGWTLGFYLRESETATTLLLSFSGPPQFTIVDEDNGVFHLDIPEANTLALPVAVYRYNIWRDDAGSKDVICFGNFTIDSQVKHTN